MEKREIDIAIISDVHLGTYGCHAQELLNYLNSIEVEMLILNGDFIDMWQFRKNYFPKEHLQVIRCILKMAARGTKVYYITGNHDDALRKISDFSTGNIHLRDQLELKLKGKRIWIFHGDIFDASIKFSPLIAKMGGKGYDLLILLNRFINKIRVALGKPKMSLAKRVKDSLKNAVKFVSDFETIAMELGAKEEFDYVICGHIHKPQMRSMEIKGHKITYLNSGDWIENLTALEYKWGRWSIYEYDDHYFSSQDPIAEVEQTEPEWESLLRKEIKTLELQLFKSTTSQLSPVSLKKP